MNVVAVPIIESNTELQDNLGPALLCRTMCSKFESKTMNKDKFTDQSGKASVFSSIARWASMLTGNLALPSTLCVACIMNNRLRPISWLVRRDAILGLQTRGEEHSRVLMTQHCSSLTPIDKKGL